MKNKIYSNDFYFIFREIYENAYWSKKQNKTILLKDNEYILAVKRQTKLGYIFGWFFLLNIFIQITCLILFNNIGSIFVIFIMIFRLSGSIPRTLYKFNREINVGDYYLQEQNDFEKFNSLTKKQKVLYFAKFIFLGVEDYKLSPRLYRIKSVHMQNYKEYKRQKTIDPKDPIPLVFYIAETID